MLRIVINNELRNRSLLHSEVWQLWHVWTVTIPRRGINGQWVWGTVCDAAMVIGGYIKNTSSTE